MAKKIILENVELGNTGKVSKDKINKNFNKVYEGLNTLDGEAVKKASVTTKLGFSQDNVPSNKAVADELKKYAQKSDVSVGMLYLGFDVPTTAQLTKPTIKNPITGETITLKYGHAVRVLDKLSEDGRPLYYQYDGENWNETRFTDLPSNVATIDDLYLNICENALSDVNTMRASKISGEGLDGAIITQDKSKITIPIGSKGFGSYFLSVFDDKELLKVISEAYVSNNHSIYAVLKYKVSDNDIASFLTPRIQADTNNKIGEPVAHLIDGDFVYLLFQVSSDLSNLSSSLRVGIQFYPKTELDKEFTFEYIDSTFFIRDNTIYSSLLAEKVSERKFVSEHTFGSSIPAYSRFGKFVGGIACNNTPTTVGGYLKSIYVKVNGSGGTMRFGIGIIDQRSWAIIREEFSVNVVTGNQTLDISDRKIVINEDERLFIFLDDIEASPMFQQGTKEGHDLMLYNDQTADGALFRLATTYGGYITLSWIVEVIHSDMFATKPEVQSVANEVKTINEAIIQVNSQLGTAPDYFGNRYELRVVDGKIVPIPMIYSNALLIGNSIIWHPLIAGVWFGLWGMAASKRERDIVHIVERGLRNKIPTATATGFNIATWERNFNIDKDVLFEDVLTPDRDLIVFRLGENIPNDTDLNVLESAFEDLVSYVISKCPSAKIVITGVLYTNSAKDIPLSNVAKKYGITYVKLSDLYVTENIIKVGDVVFGDDGLEHVITKESNVQGHPNDRGQGYTGNRILTSVSYETVELEL